jgi:2-succinyl-6-hydroxy-2,4-cyclohexadiene-1-carboxylate synthase
MAADEHAADPGGIDPDVIRARAGGLGWRIVRTGPPAGPPVLLLHGFTGRAESWIEVAGRLPRRRCWIPDLPGHGNTDPPLPPERWRMPRLADALLELLDSLGIGSIDVAGYSMGGRAALHLAVTGRNCISRLVLVGATPGIESTIEREERASSELALARMLEEQGIEAFVDYWEALPLFATQRTLDPIARARLRDQRLSHDPAALAAGIRAFGTGFQDPIHESLSGITAPTLLVSGERDEKFRQIAESMHRRIPDARMEIVLGAGHAVPSERPAALAALLESHLSPIGIQGGIAP